MIQRYRDKDRDRDVKFGNNLKLKVTVKLGKSQIDLARICSSSIGSENIYIKINMECFFVFFFKILAYIFGVLFCCFFPEALQKLCFEKMKFNHRSCKLWFVKTL